MTTLPNACHDPLPHPAGCKVSWSGPWGPDQDARRPVTAVAAATAIAGAVHLGVGLGHGPAGHGLLFLAVGATQVASALLVHRRPSRRRLAAVIAINTGVVVAWLLTYTPTDGRGAEITAAGLTATALEVAAALIAVTIRRRHTAGPLRRTSARAVTLVGAAAVAAGIFGWSGHSHTHHHDQAPPITASAETEPIFGDLFTDHHHTPGADPDGRTHRHDHSEPHGH